MQSSFEAMFCAFRDAGIAYSILSDRLYASDVELSRDPDYQRLLMCGMTIARIGGGAAITGAIKAMPARPEDLARFWSGMETW